MIENHSDDSSAAPYDFDLRSISASTNRTALIVLAIDVVSESFRRPTTLKTASDKIELFVLIAEGEVVVYSRMRRRVVLDGRGGSPLIFSSSLVPFELAEDNDEPSLLDLM